MQDNGSAVVIFFLQEIPGRKLEAVQKAGGRFSQRRGRGECQAEAGFESYRNWSISGIRCAASPFRSVSISPSLSLSPLQRVRSKSISRCPRASRSHSPRQTFALSSIIRLHKLHPHSFPSPSRD